MPLERTGGYGHSQVNGWELREDEQKRLRLRRRLVAKNFADGLKLCERIGELAEAEGHHPDLHLTVSSTPPTSRRPMHSAARCTNHSTGAGVLSQHQSWVMRCIATVALLRGFTGRSKQQQR